MHKYFKLIILPSYLFSDNYSLSAVEEKSIQMAKKWMNNNTKIERQNDGSLSFYYGDNMPSLICKPLNATIIKLGKDEVIKDFKTGDSERWKFDTVANAVDGRSFMLVKPMVANIMTNLIIFTDKRIYNIKLISTKNTWTPAISFIYRDKPIENKVNKKPIENKVNKKPIENKVNKKPINKPIVIKKHVKPAIKKTEYTFRSDGSWTPKNVFTKHGKTYITLDDQNIEDIRLYILNQNHKTITYRYRANQLVINAILKKAILIKDNFSKTIVHIRRNK